MLWPHRLVLYPPASAQAGVYSWAAACLVWLTLGACAGWKGKVSPWESIRRAHRVLSGPLRRVL